MNRYIIVIHIDEQSRTYHIDALDRTQAVERLKLRLPPHQRESFTIQSLQIDPDSFFNDSPFGTFYP